jgi:hypothetical protein
MGKSVAGLVRVTTASAVLASALGVLGCGQERNEPADSAGSGDVDVAAALDEIGTTGWSDREDQARLVAPLSGSVTGSRRPVLRWHGPRNAAVEICADRACQQPLSVFAGYGHEARPKRSLPIGSVFWRVLTRGPHSRVHASSTWEVFVARDGHNPHTTRGLRYDANADGFADGAVRAQDGNARTDVLHVFTGGPGGLDPARDVMLTLDTTSFGTGFSAAGDVDGDGFGDFVLDDGRGIVVYGGSPAGPKAAPLAVIPPPPSANPYNFGFEVAGLGDVNGDGYGDLLVSQGTDLTWVYLGGPTGPSATPAWVADNAITGLLLHWMVAGDFDGDGFADLMFADVNVDSTTNGFRLFRGGRGGLEPATAGTFVASPSTFLVTGTAGDINGDGTIDLVTLDDATVSVFPGGPDFPGSAPTDVLTLAERPGPMQIGDFNGDGASDLAITTSTQTSNIYFTDDRVDIYLGGPVGLAATPSQTLLETSFLADNQLNFGLRLGNADFDRDGREDLMVAAPPPYPTPFFDSSASAVFIFPGSATLAVVPTPTRLDGTPGFGDWVSAGDPQSGI